MSRKQRRNRSPVKTAPPQQPVGAANTGRGMTADKAVQQLLGQMLASGRYTQDAYSNPLARLGWGTPNLSEGTAYPLTRLTNNYQLINALYRNHWIVRKIIDTIPEDMTRNWIRVTSQLEPDQIVQLDRSWRTRNLQEQILHGLKWGRLYGGAAGLMMIEGHEQMLDQPLDYNTILPGSLKGLMVVDRWVGAYPSEELEEDIGDPDFGLPKFYMVTLVGGDVLRIHHSRIIRFVGRQLPYWEQLAEVYWGESEIEIVYEELKKRDNTSYNLANLIFLSNIRVLKMQNLGEMLAVGDMQAQQDLYNVVQQQNWLMSNQGMQLLGNGDDMDFRSASFAGLNDIYESFMMDISGAAQIPVTRLFGRSPSGMDASGDADLQHYYETVEQAQESALRPVLNQLLPVLCVSELGAIPDDLDYQFNPIQRPDDSDIADLVDKRTTSVINAYNAGLISQRVALEELRQMSDDTGAWSNITDEDIARADDTVVPEGELMPLGQVPQTAEGLASQETGTDRPEESDRGRLPQRDPTRDAALHRYFGRG